VNPESRDGSASAGPSRTFSVALRLGCLLAAFACASERAPDPNLEKVWRDYRRLPDQRALAVSGNVEHDRFVAGSSGGHATIPDAEAAALRECGVRRLKMRQQAACKIYAIGDEIVWPGP
jgi:hypothetical protein